MKLILRVGVAAAIHTLFILPASAQWQGSAGVSARALTNTEYEEAGGRLVRENGWLPGLAAGVAYGAGRHTWFAEGEFHDRAIEYQGQTQAGAAITSKTETGLTMLRIGDKYALGGNYSVSAALEWEQWKRDILGAQGASGLQERYQSKRLVAGVEKSWHPAAGAVSASAAVVLSEAERLRVEFSGLLDPATFKTKSAQGIRIGASIRPSFAPYLELRSSYDRIKVARSGDAPATLDGRFMGTITEPEHTKQSITFTAAYIF